MLHQHRRIDAEWKRTQTRLDVKVLSISIRFILGEEGHVMSLSTDDVRKSRLVIGRDSLTSESDGVDLDGKDLRELSFGNSVSEEDQLQRTASQLSFSTGATDNSRGGGRGREEGLTLAGRFLFFVTN